MTINLTQEEIAEIVKALKKQSRYATEEWMTRVTDRRVQSISDRLFDQWVSLAQFWSFPNMAQELESFFSSVRTQ